MNTNYLAGWLATVLGVLAASASTYGESAATADASQPPLDKADALAAIIAKASSAHTVDVWYRSTWKDDKNYASLNHLIWNLTSSKWTVEQYVLQSSDSENVLTKFTQTVEGGKCVTLSQAAYGQGEIRIGKDCQPHITGPLHNSGSIDNSTRSMPIPYQDLTYDPTRHSNIFKILPSWAHTMTFTTEAGAKLCEMGDKDTKLIFNVPEFTLREMKTYDQEPNGKAFVEHSVRRVNSYQEDNGVPFPSEFTIQFLPIYPHETGSTNFVSIVPGTLKINGNVDGGIVTPRFPPGTDVMDEVNQTIYTVSAFDDAKASADTLINSLNAAVQKAEEQKKENGKH